MRKLFTATLLFFTAAAASAMTFYDQLCAFNFNWKKYALQAPPGDARTFSCDREYIQAHLENVLKILRAENTDGLSSAQKTSREKMLTLLDGYRLAGKFPMNYYRHERIPVFIDEHGTHCAVGYLMMMTGEEEMAQRISRTDNYAWVKDIHDPGVAAWQEASGLSVENLKLIQGAYDSYRWDALLIVERYQTPQRPAVTTAYFSKTRLGATPAEMTDDNIWFKGEGENGVLNGKWVQNYAKGIPWIEGYYENGERTGQWKEYYQGTDKLCRTERWSNNKLNGTRTRWDRDGNVIEEILFTNGQAVSKINYERADSLVYIRIPEDSLHVYTQVLNFRGELIACGHESIYNPGNLLWFQNIELTALNSASISARSMANGNNINLFNGGENGLYNTPPLVQYKKEGDWMYYRDTVQQYAALKSGKTTPVELFRGAYQHYGNQLFGMLMMFEGPGLTAACDSVKVTYDDDLVQEFYGYVNNDFVHLHIAYFKQGTERYHKGTYYGLPAGQISETGRYNSAGERTGEWHYFDVNGTMYKSENYAVPRREIIGMKN